MTRDEFWQLIDDAYRESGGSLRRRKEAVARRLAALPPDEIVSYANHFYAVRGAAYRWDLWAAAFIMGGGCSDDGFLDFRSWLISRGRRAYEDALRDPETLVEAAEGEEYWFFEEMTGLAWRAYDAKTGQDLPPAVGRGSQPADPIGEPFDEDEDALERKFPKLFARFWEDA